MHLKIIYRWGYTNRKLVERIYQKGTFSIRAFHLAIRVEWVVAWFDPTGQERTREYPLRNSVQSGTASRSTMFLNLMEIWSAPLRGECSVEARDSNSKFQAAGTSEDISQI